MRLFLITFLLTTACSPNQSASGFKQTTAPWSDQKFEVCPSPNKKGLKIAIFEPIVEEWSYKEAHPLSVEYQVVDGGVREIIVDPPDMSMPAFHLVEQRIGYIDSKDYWVDEAGNRIIEFDQIDKVSGKKAEPTKIKSSEKLIYKHNFELESAIAMHYLRIWNEQSLYLRFGSGHETHSKVQLLGKNIKKSYLLS